MKIKPYSDWPIVGLARAIVSSVGLFIAFVAAGEPKFSSHWWLTVMWVGVAYFIIIWLLQLGWSRWRIGQNQPR